MSEERKMVLKNMLLFKNMKNPKTYSKLKKNRKNYYFLYKFYLNMSYNLSFM
jgi:hypothetical protein